MKMRILALATATALGLCAPAHAFTPGGTFTLTGPFSLGLGAVTVPCTAKLLVASVSNQVLSVTFTGSALCTGVSATGLPWTTSQNPVAPSFTILNMALTTPLGACPATTATGAWSNTAPGAMTIPLTVMSGTCRIVAASLSASPAQTLP